jgi:LysR family transcriptional regulator, hydrogen peroxide-inducible genes activator
VPEVAAEVELRDNRVRLLRFAHPEPVRTIGLAWRRTSPRRKDFEALAAIVVETIGSSSALPGRKGKVG